jgi:RNA polymerase sigma factor (sigma-70 family)
MTKTIAAPMDDHNDYAVLVKGNTLAKTWARKVLGRRKLGKFLSVVLDPRRGEALGVPQEKVEAIVAIPSEDRDAIFATQDVTCRVFNKFDKLALRIARKFAAGVGRDNDADVAQLESEARVGLLKAIRGYSNIEIKFITYAHRVIQNEVSRYIQRCMGMGLTGANATLLVRYKCKVEELTKASLPHSFEDVCRELELSAGQTSRLKDALRSEVTSESEMEDNLASVLVDSHRDTNVDLELIDRLNNTVMTKMETLCWYCQSEEIRVMFPEVRCDCSECRKRMETDPTFKGERFESLKDVALHFDVTPQAASEALKRARKKLAASLGDDWQR